MEITLKVTAGNSMSITSRSHSHNETNGPHNAVDSRVLRASRLAFVA